MRRDDGDAGLAIIDGAIADERGREGRRRLISRLVVAVMFVAALVLAGAVTGSLP